MKDKLNEWFQWLKVDKKLGYLLIIALCGLLLLLLGKTFQSPQQEAEETPPLQLEQNVPEDDPVSKDIVMDSSVRELEASYERALKHMLENINGVSNVDVMVNLDATNLKVYEKNIIIGTQTTDETDQNGGVRKMEDQTEERQVVLVRQGDQEVPLLIQTKKPEVRGVFIVAEGVDHATVKMWVIESVSKVLDVPTYKISVMPKN